MTHPGDVVGWTWNVWHDMYPWTDGGTALKVFRTKEEAVADCLSDMGADEDDIVPVLLRMIDGSGHCIDKAET